MYWFHFCLYMYEDNRFREDGAENCYPTRWAKSDEVTKATNFYDGVIAGPTYFYFLKYRSNMCLIWKLIWTIWVRRDFKKEIFPL